MADAYRRFAEVDALFERVLAVPADERPAFLEDACGSDEELKSAVTRLLESARQDGELEERTALANLGSRAAALAIESESEQFFALEPGSEFGAYVVVDALGSGGMGEVYRARDRRLGREVALKALPSEFEGDRDRLARLEREARLLAALSHPHINTIHELEESQGRKALVLELVEGRTLAEHLADGPIPIRQALVWTKQIAEALSAAHGRGVLHRDLKPANVKITTDGLVKVLDFGLAVTVNAPAGAETQAPTNLATLTHEGRILGTAPYMSPEQWRGQPANRGSDLWALGCVLYEVLTGARAFAGTTRADAAAAVLEREPDWKALPNNTPHRIEELLRRCLDKDPARRLADANEAAQEVEQALGEIGESGGGGLRLPAVGGGRWAVALLALVTIAVALVWFALSRYESELASPPLGVIHSIAVLPFENTGDAPDSEYLSNGLTESLINSLSKLPELRVVPRGIVFGYKGRPQDPLAAASELGVRAVVTGRVGERDGRLILSAELMDAHEVAQLWGEQYTRPADDLIEIQEELVLSIVEELRLQLTPEQRQRALDPATDNPEAFRLYLRSTHHTFKLTPDGVERGIDYAQQAVELDPGFALAYVALSQAHMTRAFLGLEPWARAGDRSRAAARRALELDDTLSEAYVEMGFVRHHFDWDWTGAERAMARAVELDADNAMALSSHSETLLSLGRVEEALAQAERAVEVNPFHPHANYWLSFCLLHAQRYEEAFAPNQAALDLEPNHSFARPNVSRLLLLNGRTDEAFDELRSYLTEEGADLESSPTLASFYAWVGQDDEARKILARLGEPGNLDNPFSHRSLVSTFAALGDLDAAFDLLEAMVEQRSRGLLFLYTDPFSEPMRGDPRFEKILRQMGLPVLETPS